jgi:hypothetical protein
MISLVVEECSLGGPKRTTSMAFRVILDRWMGFVTPRILVRYDDPTATWMESLLWVRLMLLGKWSYKAKIETIEIYRTRIEYYNST